MALLIALVVVSIFIAPSIAIDHLVGDDQGWKLNFDYNAWTETKEFHVGDKLIFKYKEGGHNVYKADLASFQGCTPSVNVEPLTSGNDVIDLKTPGKKWYFCGVNNHCEQGMKIAINVLPVKVVVGAPSSAPSSPPAGSSNAYEITPNSIFVAALLMFFKNIV